MDIWQADKLALFIAFVVPGFISLKAYELLCPGQRKDSADRVVDAVAYSSINYALVLWPIYQVETHDVAKLAPSLYVLFYVFILLVTPVSWACLLYKLRKTKFVQRALPHPTGRPWDWLFAQKKPYFVIVTLRDGSKVAGMYGFNSFSSDAPEPEQLYLEQTWVLNADGGFERQRRATAGIIILASDMVTVELFDYKGDSNGGSGQEQSGPSAEGLPAAEATSA